MTEENDEAEYPSDESEEDIDRIIVEELGAKELRRINKLSHVFMGINISKERKQDAYRKPRNS